MNGNNDPLRDYIKRSKVFHLSAIAERIGMDASNFHKWYIGTRPLPAERRKKLDALMARFGYMPPTIPV